MNPKLLVFLFTVIVFAVTWFHCGYKKDDVIPITFVVYGLAGCMGYVFGLGIRLIKTYFFQG